MVDEGKARPEPDAAAVALDRQHGLAVGETVGHLQRHGIDAHARFVGGGEFGLHENRRIVPVDDGKRMAELGDFAGPVPGVVHLLCFGIDGDILLAHQMDITRLGALVHALVDGDRKGGARRRVLAGLHLEEPAGIGVGHHVRALADLTAVLPM